VFFGLGIHWVGMSLTFPIAIGLSTALGSLIPMAETPAVFLTPAGAATTVGVAVMVAGVALCGWAGVERDARLGRGTEGDGQTQVVQGRRRLMAGLIVVALSGLTDPFLNFAFNFGQRIKDAALGHGASAGAESDAIWALALTGSLVVNGVYCCVLLTRNGSWRRFREQGTGHYWPLAALMGLLWMSSITLYGRGASAMGPLGGSVGWAVFYGCIIVFSTLWGIVCGEWRAGHGRPMRTLAGGLAVLLLAIVILGYGNSLAAER
jgi:L-rhamnose-H+ transport protein